MSYSCSDFANDCDQNAYHYKVPELTAEQRDMMELPDDPEEWSEDEQLRALAERVAGVMSDRADFLALLRDAAAFLDSAEGTAARTLRQRIAAALPS